VAYARKVVLHCPKGYQFRLDHMVEDFIRDGVIYVGVVGKDCSKVEDIIDQLVLGDDASRDYDLLTASHPDESLDAAISFAKSLTGDFAGDEVQIVEL